MFRKRQIYGKGTISKRGLEGLGLLAQLTSMAMVPMIS